MGQSNAVLISWTRANSWRNVWRTHQRVYSMVNQNGIDELNDDATLLEQWKVVNETLKRALNDPALANAPVRRSERGEQPFSALVEGLLMIDTLCPTWDLARAVNANESLDGAAVAIAYEKLTENGRRHPGPGRLLRTPSLHSPRPTRRRSFSISPDGQCSGRVASSLRASAPQFRWRLARH